MKVLVLGDIHGRKFWRETIEKYADKVDKIIFLGDYLDPYPDEFKTHPESMECKDFFDSQNLLKMLEDIVALKKKEPEKYILLCGNHTCSYIWSKFRAASRTDYRHWEGYHKFFSQNLNLFNLVWTEDNVIFSHAGITNGWAYNFLSIHMKYDKSALDKISFIQECAEVLRDTKLQDFDSFYIEGISEISSYRGGIYNYGSCEWADIKEHLDMYESYKQQDLIPIGDDSVYQVFGHTKLSKSPIITSKWACLDCRKGFIFNTITHECNSCL